MHSKCDPPFIFVMLYRKVRYITVLIIVSSATTFLITGLQEGLRGSIGIIFGKILLYQRAPMGPRKKAPYMPNLRALDKLYSCFFPLLYALLFSILYISRSPMLIMKPELITFDINGLRSFTSTNH